MRWRARFFLCSGIQVEFFILEFARKVKPSSFHGKQRESDYQQGPRGRQRPTLAVMCDLYVDCRQEGPRLAQLPIWGRAHKIFRGQMVSLLLRDGNRASLRLHTGGTGLAGNKEASIIRILYAITAFGAFAPLQHHNAKVQSPLERQFQWLPRTDENFCSNPAELASQHHCLACCLPPPCQLESARNLHHHVDGCPSRLPNLEN